ncbi:HU family DNA-binding protein [Nocardioides sp. ChNu-153]|uniref:HU family DNA-binding protein n=1 Tax=unclassified Nocardioides TaxID=2615069 RepID=UPI00240647E9|nr:MULTISPECIES: HU family DNA-binding protein [unclassified Nocardioides]MDF9715061.1 HU family DNA-binding protein [Nocardioides sp. ChNu-99]MDN7122330.1 HU family DNA-binding protein [Nocardioides sp. ChNu-153]
MNKKELVDQVAEATGLGKGEAESAANAVFDAIGKALAAGDKVAVAGFGTFETRERAARTGRNPQTGEEIQIAASTTPAFKAAAALKKTVAG